MFGCFIPFKIQIFPKFFFLIDLVKTKYFFEKSAQSDVFKELWVPILKGPTHPNIVLMETDSFKTLRLCNKWSFCPPVRLNKNKILSLLTGGQYAQDRMRERRNFFSTNIPVTRTPNIEDLKKMSD